MRRANILKIIANSSVAVGLGAMSLFGGVAHAQSFDQRVQAAMNRGLDYSAAVTEASRADGPLYSSSDRAYTTTAQSAMYRGRDYSAAWEEASRAAPVVFSPEQVAKAQKAREEIDEGVDYAAAWEDNSYGQPAAPVRAASKGGNVSAQERTRSTK